MSQKVIKIGKSTGVTLSKDILEKINLKAGDEVVVNYDEKKGCVYINPKTKVLVKKLTIKWADKFIEENRSLLEDLSKR